MESHPGIKVTGIDHSINTGRGLYTFRINGQNYHRIGSLLPTVSFQPRYAQLYFFDTHNEVRNRMSAFLGGETAEVVDATIVTKLITMLDQTSVVAQAFWMARNWCHSHESVNFKLHLLSERKTVRQYNASTVSEVAALITNDFGDGIPSRDIVVHSRDEDSLHTNRGTRKTNRGYVSMKEYYAYVIHQRNDQGNTLLRGGRLYQQYLVDAFTAVEEQRLQWTRNNQDTLRVDLYHNLNDAFTRGDINAEGLGKRIVLPRTFTGEMLTFIPGQKPYERPEVGTRVFKLKLTLLLDDLTKNQIFRKACAVVYVIEFQKRGLSHAPELPSPTIDPEGYKAVTEFMLHGPCGKGSACTVEGKCSKKYPKPFYPETNLVEDGYLVYRRRDSKVQAVKGKFTYDNKYVVPYNQYPLLKYQAHINVEWCNRSKAIKYLFKYYNKGPDRATFVIQENVEQPIHGEPQKVAVVDEIKHYLNCRYLAPCEAVWRLFLFDIHYSYPSIMKLNYHLEDQQAITLRDSENFPAVINREELKITMFTEWEWAHAIKEAAFWALAPNGRSLTDFPSQNIPRPNPALLTQIDNRLIREAMDFDVKTSKLEHDKLHSLIASLLLPGGRTAHSRFVIPLELVENSTCGIKQNTHLAELLQQVELIIWDEAPMTQKYAFEALDRTLRDILGYKNPCKRSAIFGGVTVLLGGDFRQILPVIPKGKRAEIVQSCINRSALWRSCQVFTLTRSMRVNEYSANGEVDYRKKEFNKWILDVGDGTQIIKETYPDFKNRRNDSVYLKERVILTPRNDDADTINAHMFDKLPGPTMTYNSADEVCKGSTDILEQQHLYPTEFLNTLNFPGMPPHALKLKKELPIMLLRNVNPSQGLCNGTRLIITDLGQFVIRAQILTGSNVGQTVLIPRITLTSTQTQWPFVMKRRQFPVKPCYAMTINKSQGQSLNHVGIYLPNPVFSHGQLYVAISRVTSPDGLKILMKEDASPDLKRRTRNIVFKETFDNLT
ncbi:DNA helicase [Tanacetum coccineum]